MTVLYSPPIAFLLYFVLVGILYGVGRMVAGPAKLTAILAGMQNWMEEKEYESLAQMKGSMSQKNLSDPSAMARASYLRVLDSFTPRPGIWS